MNCDRKEIKFSTSSVEDMQFIVDSIIAYTYLGQATVRDLSYVDCYNSDNQREIKVTIVVDFNCKERIRNDLG